MRSRGRRWSGWRRQSDHVAIDQRYQPSFRGTGGTPMILFVPPQRHAPRQAQRIIGISPVFPIRAKGDDQKPEGRSCPLEPLADFPALIPQDTGGTPIILFVPPQRHAPRQAQCIIGVSPVFPIRAKGDDQKPEGRSCPLELLADFPALIPRDTGGTPMILFVPPQRHARRQAQRIIGVSPVFPILARIDDQKPEANFAREAVGRFPALIPRDTGGTHMILFARPQRHARRQAQRYHRRLACVPDSRRLGTRAISGKRRQANSDRFVTAIQAALH
jgi:hypothetical protein